MNPNDYQPQQPPEEPSQQPSGEPSQQPNLQGGQSQYTQPQFNTYEPQPNMQSTQPVASQPQPTYGQTSTSSSGSKGKIFAIIGGVIVLIVIIVLAITLFGNKGNGPIGSNKSSTGGSSSGGSTKTACQLYTLTDAQGIIGPSAKSVTVHAQPTAIPNATSSICTYQTPNQSAVLIIGVIYTSSSSNADLGYSHLLSYFSQMSGSSAIPISGLGDKASYFSNGAIVVEKGNVDIDVLDVGGSSSQSQDQQIVTTILSRL